MTQFLVRDTVLGGYAVTNSLFNETEYWEVPDGTNADDVYIKDGEVFYFPVKPSTYHVWDSSTEAWIDDSGNQIGTIKAEALSTINRITSAIRERFVTPISSQSTVLELKRQQAAAFLAELSETAAQGLEPDPSSYPLVYAEVGITADTAENVAQVYLGLNAIYLQILALVEQSRLTAVNSVENAVTKEQVDSALAAFITATESVNQ